MKAKDVENLIEKIGTKLGCGDFTYGAEFIEGREDIATIKHTAEDGVRYGYDTIYLVWERDGKLNHRHIQDSSDTKEYLNVRKAVIEENEVVVHVDKREHHISLESLGL